MTYIELAQKVRERIGIQGSGPAAVSTTIPVEKEMVQAVYDTWIDIQNHRADWKWMRAADSFFTTQGTSVYEVSSILDPGYRFSRWHKDSFLVTVDSQKSEMWYLNYERYYHRHKNTTAQNKIREFTIRDWDDAVIITPPDGAYTVSLEYQKSNQLLSANTDTPELPVDYHMLIVYGAMEKMAASMISEEQYNQYSQQYATGMGDLTRHQLVKKSVVLRGLA